IFFINLQTIVDVLRQAAKTCVVKREFRKAEFLIKQALHTARINFDPKHPKFGDTLLDYGFYLLNVDSINKSVIVYQKALDVWQTAFGGYNLHVAIVHEDLAYASYVHEYSSGNFKVARDHAEKAMDIMHHLLPQDHLLLASSKRVKALILEEIAIDNQDKAIEHKLLLEAQELHLSALRLAQQAFGEMNVQTAKHYGNLGRLYQSMKKFNDAEEMHLKAIHIKKELLGPDDYEVALSVGHLASLYNYDMELFERAEELYLRSIEIGVKLFGEGYSGLEYDYRGLLRVYTFLGEPQKYMNYQQILQRWNEIRNRSTEREKHQCPLSLQMELVPPENLFPMLHSLE
ncbi:amyloid protein-binding protein 2-like, partial [Limulus polyphemus]|uniref:Amyloid protein-binding protein 2-like n=1 Tax=Limulus polyphemus TaxID=6850 RepID=A0ABM1C108_LIMPO